MSVFTLWPLKVAALALSLFPTFCIAGNLEGMVGCYAMERNGQPDIRFYQMGGDVHWDVRRRAGWKKQEPAVQFFDERRPHPDFSAETFKKVEGMFDMGDMFFLIKFKKDRVEDVQGHDGLARGLDAMKQSGSPFLISINGVGPAFPVVCEEMK